MNKHVTPSSRGIRVFCANHPQEILSTDRQETITHGLNIFVQRCRKCIEEEDIALTARKAFVDGADFAIEMHEAGKDFGPSWADIEAINRYYDGNDPDKK